MKIGIVAKKGIQKAKELAKDIYQWLTKRGHIVFLVCDETKTDEANDFEGVADRELDFIVVLSGDGTILSVARSVSRMNTPIFGINLGHFGFLTEVDPVNAFIALDEVLKGEYKVEERSMLNASVIRDGKSVNEFTALNDVVVSKGSFARIIRLLTYVNDERFLGVQADGMIVSTPTGSTAYSLSAGGPIVSPAVDALLLTPICAHTLFSRSLVVSGNDVIRIEVESSHENIAVTFDGQSSFPLMPNDTVIVKKSQSLTRFIRLKSGKFYEIVGNRLREGRF